MSAQFDKVKTTAGRWGRRFLWILFFVLVGVGIGYYIYRNYTISEGSRTGTLVKMSRKGVLFKTYEGQLHLAGSTIMNTQSSWEFSVSNKAAYEALQKLEGNDVTVYYNEKVDAFPWQGDTDYLVFKAEKANISQSK
ncbi:MAG: hypothetical protein IT270_03960 [Saprospiraceae bacterium]|nr:hypothetical protein [Saprospiraceae bacterium]